NDGIKNGDEVVTDCGGSKCEPCITGCTDINAHNYNPNAHITNNVFCETCNDGIQNGDESGVDCGGKKCAPCNCTTTDFISATEQESDMSIHAQNTIISSDTIANAANVIYIAGQSIVLSPGFEINLSAIFTAQVEACN
ncbi:MAG: 3-coathanger stack domain-containing protein, partial [Saprospiraceae bacterium]